ncbi:Uncharacterised protein [Slackia heliotrinireducens]|uniref:Uncharacterized protein n=1 Tax=Slackia heliotrinireducens (strain ATCC 29202 / DSM 20476 / NCTC 11029 / RHS 1) TaxID=471855 RepID=C7N7Z6_SLAHD|nr:hypothetical protein [Slackia heliotrinireducens]ACV23031.1 hypothetical protein Shel_20170 [Slackia heliotrinireducens DSM 20476]VEH01951.1 Uncharacterised protein [Slackia heliotrinireducens]
MSNEHNYDDEIYDVWEVDTINGIVHIVIDSDNAHMSVRELYELYGIVEYYDDPWLFWKQRAAATGEEFDLSLYDFGDE